MRKAFKYILGFEPHDEGIWKLQIKGKYNNITLINLYAPTKDKKQFYEDLKYVVDNVPTTDILVVIILGVLNAKLGKEQVQSCPHIRWFSNPRFTATRKKKLEN
jgi:hypothetical protein